MRTEIIAVLINEVGKIASNYLRSRPIRIKTEQAQIPEPIQRVEIAVGNSSGNGKKKEGVATGCVPCAIGHLGTCTGLLNEAMRFARAEGLQSDEVIDRANICLDELNTMERVDLVSEKIADLPDWEKALANQALEASRATRHSLEGLKSVDDLEQAAAATQETRQKIGRSWFRERMKRMSPGEKTELKQRVMRRIETLGEDEEQETEKEEPAADEAEYQAEYQPEEELKRVPRRR